MAMKGDSQGLRPEDLLEKDYAELKEGIRLLFVNEFQKAEDVFRNGASRERRKSGAASSGGAFRSRDTRGAFALIYALVSFMFGLLSFANDQLDECLSRIWASESVLLEDSPWVGQKMLLGMAYLIAGVVQAAKNAWLKAGINFVRSLRFIKDFEEGLHFEGPEEAMVRSTALFFLGLFNLVLSTMPPQLLRVASKAGGSTLHGSRSEALRLLCSCHEQDGVMAPFAVIVLLAYRIWIKTYLGEAITEDDFAKSRVFLQWAAERYPGSAVFGFWQGELHAVRTELEEASSCVLRVHLVLAHLNLPAVDSFLEQKKAMLSLSALQWQNAAGGFERSLSVSVTRQRRSYVPTLSYLAGLCRLLCDEPAESHENFARVLTYSKMRKWNWPPEDDLAFQKVKGYGTKLIIVDRNRALLDIVEISMLKIHVLHTMPADAKRKLLDLLRTCGLATEQLPEEATRSLLFRAELSRLLGDLAGARQLGLQALELLPKLSDRGAANGTAATLHLTLALLGVEGHMAAFDSCPKACRAYDEALKFKKMGLGRKLELADGTGEAENKGPAAEKTSAAEDTAEEEGPFEEAEDEFFSAEEEDDAPPSGSPSGSRARGSKGSQIDSLDEAAKALRASLKWGSEVAAKALRDVAKKSATAATVASGYSSALLAPTAGNSGSAVVSGSSQLHLEALLQQAEQGDCSIVSIPPPSSGASDADVLAYLKWAHWSSLRDTPRIEALRQHALLVQSSGRDRRSRKPRPSLGSGGPSGGAGVSGSLGRN